MAILLLIAVVLATLSLGLSTPEERHVAMKRSISSELTVPNGQTFGKWTWTEMCLDNFYAAGFSLRVEPNQQSGDDTSLNGIRLFCAKPGELIFLQTIESHTGHWGDWSRFKYCPGRELLISFQLRVEGNQGSGDDTAANNINFRCSDHSVLEGDGNGWGEYGPWSQECSKGICGIETNMEDVQGEGDDTSLNDVRFFCCS